MLYNRKFEVEFPQLNFPLILYKYIKYLALPGKVNLFTSVTFLRGGLALKICLVEIYPAARRLHDLLGFTYAFPTEVKGRRKHLHLPEIQIIAIIVVCTKLYFPFDNMKRYPTSVKQPAAQVIDWTLWGQNQREFDRRETAGGQIGRGNEILTTEQDALKMTTNQLDEYMDWYEKSWLDASKGTRLIRHSSHYYIYIYIYYCLLVLTCNQQNPIH